MNDTVAPGRRSRRIAVIRRRSTAASLGILTGAFILVGMTKSPPEAPVSSATAARNTPVASADRRLPPPAPAATTPPRIKTRQS